MWLLDLSQTQREGIKLGHMDTEGPTDNCRELQSLPPTWQVTKHISWPLKLWPHGSRILMTPRKSTCAHQAMTDRNGLGLT